VWYKSTSAGYDIDIPSRKVSGYLASFNNRDEDGDVLLPGAFDKSLREHGVNSISARKIIFLYMHDLARPIGRFTTLKADDKGLYFEADIDPTDDGEQVLTQYATGTLNQHSIGFRYVWDKVKYEDATETFHVGEVKLYEGSVVSIGMNENTPFLGFKGLTFEEEQDRLMGIFEEHLKVLEYKDNIAIRQVVNKMIALNQADKPLEVKQALVEQGKPQGIDWQKVADLIKVK
jgi:hypothetical protein